MGKKDTMKCSMGFQLVTDEDQCRRSATKLGKKFGRTPGFAVEIPGCYDNGDSIHFSKSSEKHYPGHTGICTGEYLPLQTASYYCNF